MASPSFLVGLALASAATLALELLDTRLLSVLTWYHLAFFVVSAAMLGMAAGAVRVYLAGPSPRVFPSLARTTVGFAGSMVGVQLLLTLALWLELPLRVDSTASSLLSLAAVAALVATPFFVVGKVLSLALTRVQGPIGRIYAADLGGAALGCALVPGLLRVTDLHGALLCVAGVALAAAGCFLRAAGGRGRWLWGAAGILGALGLANGHVPFGLRLRISKGEAWSGDEVAFEGWDLSSYVLVRAPILGPPRYWGAEEAQAGPPVRRWKLTLDGAAATWATAWDGDPASAAWVERDVTTLGYRLGSQGTSVAVIGVGGGRDILAALQAGASQVTGLEVNPVLVRLHRGLFRKELGLLDHPGVSLLHSEARTWLVRHPGQFDLVQMSLVDTWAASASGAFTLVENGLYTREAWAVFLGALQPGGVLSVSRWYDPDRVSETTRLVALATASLLDRGVARPRDGLFLAACGSVATLLVRQDGFTPEQVATLRAVSQDRNFQVVLAPDAPGRGLLGDLVAAPSLADLERRVAGEVFDYSPPTDLRPYFFNLLKPGLNRVAHLDRSGGVILSGNLLATLTLLVLAAVAAVGVLATVLLPLARTGRPGLSTGPFVAALGWFGSIGAGYMLVQVASMQRFSVYLGPPGATLALVLGVMVLASGGGSLASDRLVIQEAPWARWRLPLALAVLLSAFALAVDPVLHATAALPGPGRAAVVVAFVAPVSFLLGFGFPVGLRCVRRLSDRALPWMWGVNGATAVLASVAAVVISMNLGIGANLWLAAALYGALALWGRGLAYRP